MSKLEQHVMVQAAAKAVLAALGPSFVPGDTERSIAQRATMMLRERGITQTWYHDCLALVLLGSRSCLSISGRDYVPAEEPVGQFNLVTVDLSPMLDGVWGDCARSFCVEDGVWVEEPADAGFRHGLAVERELHATMRELVRPQTSFGELYEFANAQIAAYGFENLDFLGNVGHSIETTRDARRYVERGNAQRLGDAGLFTFEPHIRAAGSRWGFKHENIYSFNADGRAVEL